jgi:hypothetical protein
VPQEILSLGEFVHLTGPYFLQQSSKLRNMGSKSAKRFVLARKTTTARGRSLIRCCSGRFLSTVTSTSKCCAMASRSGPSSRSAQPILGTVRTSCLGNSLARRLGTQPSRSTRTEQLGGNSLGKKGRLRKLQDCDSVLARNARKVRQKVVQGIPLFKIVNEGLHRDPRPCKDGYPAKATGGHGYQRVRN